MIYIHKRYDDIGECKKCGSDVLVEILETKLDKYIQYECEECNSKVSECIDKGWVGCENKVNCDKFRCEFYLKEYGDCYGKYLREG